MAQRTHELRMIGELFHASQVSNIYKLDKMLHLLTSSERQAGVQPADTRPAIEFGLPYVDPGAHVRF